LWRIAVLTAAGVIGIAAPAEAAIFWSDSDPGVSQAAPMVPQQGPKPRRHAGKKVEAPGKQSAKPRGPLVIAISINKQNMKIYDANGFFAETPISTGMPGHSTPMGVFSVIQKQKLHHSNIYSGAPMPYMQRITWSGIAIHAGVLPGYPASHGCIRMPMAFAVKMWGWTKMGARVVVVPGELSPASFSHPLLVTQKVVPQPVAAEEPKADAPPAVKSDKASDAGAGSKSATAEASLELRSTVGHDQKPVMDEPSAPTPLHEQTHTADAGVLPATKAPVTMSDASASDGNAREDAAAGTGAAPTIAANTVERAEIAAAEVKPVETTSSEAAAPEIRSAVAEAADKAGTKPEEAQAPAQVSSDAASTEASASDGINTGATKAEPKADDVITAAPKADASGPDEKSSEKPDENVKPAVDISTSIPDANKDQTRLPDTAKPSKPDPAMAAAPKRTGQISVFVSRKDSKLYVRQNFAPLFEVPVTIAPSDRPLGTHVFTAQVDSDDANVLHWSVVSLPAPTRRDEDERASRRRKIAGAAEIKPIPVPDSPAEALDRLSIPADAMTRITDALSTGGSIIVSDQGIAGGETGEGTDFIVSLR
jgi:lipoprotein-anchoring transpeptidase ErfK/SrfK